MVEEDLEKIDRGTDEDEDDSSDLRWVEEDLEKIGGGGSEDRNHIKRPRME